MKLCNLDHSPMMEVAQLRRSGSNLVISGTIMGSMPVTCLLTPTQARGFLGLLSFRLFVFIGSMMFRS